MPKLVLNDAGVARLTLLIDGGEIDPAEGWEWTDEDARNLLGEPENWDFFGTHFLGLDEDAPAGTRERFLFPFAKKVGERVLVNAAALDQAVLDADGVGVVEIAAAAGDAAARVGESKIKADEAETGAGDAPGPDGGRLPPYKGPGVPVLGKAAHVGKLIYRSVVQGKVHEIRDNDVHYRSFMISKREIDVEARLVPLVFSSEAEVDRGWCIEILDHSPGCVRMHRMQNKAALLAGHNPDNQIGVIEQAEISDDRLGLAWSRFGRSDKAEEYFVDVLDAIRCHTSVGYLIHDAREFRRPDGRLVVHVTDWEPFEVSIVPIQADVNPKVGVARSFGTEYPVEIQTKERKPMNTETMTREQFREAENERTRQINEYAGKFGKDDLAKRHIQAGTEFGEFRMILLEEIGQARQVTHEQIREESKIGMTDKEIGEYSVYRMIEAQVTKDWSKAGLERAAHEAASAKSERRANGAFVPYDVMAGRRDINVANGASESTSGATLVGVDHLAGSFIEMLRPTSVLAGLGMKVLDGLVGSVSIPRRATGATFYVFNNETGTVTESNPTFDAVTASPTTVGAMVDITRRMLQQSSPAVEGLTRQDIIEGMAAKIDSLGLTGSGSAPNPYGIINTTGIGPVVGGATGAAPDWADIVNLETQVNKDNALSGSLAYVFSPKVKGFLKTTEKASGTAQFIMGEGNELNGYRAVTSSQMPDTLAKSTSGSVLSALLFGNFADAMLFLWGGLDIKVDEVTNGASGGIRLYAFQDMWFSVRHAESFAAMLDAAC